MAKGQRSKYKRRIKSVRRQHYMEIQGNQLLQDISNKLHDPLYDIVADHGLPVNAFIEPNDPNAIFPQYPKPNILDFRSHKMAGDGFASIGNFRKSMSTNSKKSKYETIVKTPEMLIAEQIEKEMQEQREKE